MVNEHNMCFKARLVAVGCLLQSVMIVALMYAVPLLKRSVWVGREVSCVLDVSPLVGRREVVSVEAIVEARSPTPIEDYIGYEGNRIYLNDTKAEQILESLMKNKRMVDPAVFDAEIVKLIHMRTVNYMKYKALGSESDVLFQAGDDSEFKEQLIHMSRQWQEEAKSKRVNVLRREIQFFEQFLKHSESVRKYWNDQLHNKVIQERGIVMSAGGQTAVVNAFVSIAMLRKVGCSLPIAIFYYGEEEFGIATRAYFSSHFENVYFDDLKKSGLPPHHWKLESHLSRRELGYMIKIASMYKSPFRHMLFMDSDAIPVQDPSHLFDTESYSTFGNMFFQDFWQDPVYLWRMLKIKEDPWKLVTADVTDIAEEERIGIPYQGESGFVLIDKARYWQVLEWLLFMNTQDAVYRFALGDKDTFRLSFYFAGVHGKYNHSPFTPALPLNEVKNWHGAEGDAETPKIRFRCLGMLQLHPEDGTPLFHHRTADAKFRPGVAQSAFRTPITHVSGPITSQQASIMNFGAPGFSIYKGGDHIAWGLADASAWVFPCLSEPGNGRTSPGCPCYPGRLDDINSRCALMNTTDVAYNPTPMPIVRLPENSPLFQISLMEIDALNSIPFIE